ncbi:hypothetical protein [Labrys sp. WJW]|uniref:hypothetical protein n=1 Tax=Labrys sp. WJW TaxID=1737983 RepID=UPI0012EABBDA|nr:hypothetical protein [Labrys sp. WJW]
MKNALAGKIVGIAVIEQHRILQIVAGSLRQIAKRHFQGTVSASDGFDRRSRHVRAERKLQIAQFRTGLGKRGDADDILGLKRLAFTIGSAVVGNHPPAEGGDRRIAIAIVLLAKTTDLLVGNPNDADGTHLDQEDADAPVANDVDMISISSYSSHATLS